MKPRTINSMRGGFIRAKDEQSIRDYFLAQGWEIVGRFAVNPDTGRRWLFVKNKAYSHWGDNRDE